MTWCVENSARSAVCSRSTGCSWWCFHAGVAAAASPPSPGFSQAFCPGPPSCDLLMPRIPSCLCRSLPGAAECCFGGSCPPRHAQREAPQWPLKPQVGEGLPCVGGEWRNNGQWRAGSKAGQLAVRQGCGVEVGRGGGWRGHDLPRQAKGLESWSSWWPPTGAPGAEGVLGRGRGIVATLPGLKLSKALPEGGREPLLNPRDRSSAPRSRGGQSRQRALLCPPWGAWMERRPRVLIASIRSSILRG